MPFADSGPINVPESLTDEQVLFLSDIFPTGYMAAENCNIRGGDTVAITHRLPLDAVADAYEIFRDKRDNCIKVVLQP